MPTPPKNPIKLYERPDDILTGVPYASISHDELTMIIDGLIAWAILLSSRPIAAAKFYEAKASHILCATDLRTALRVSRENHTYPNIVLPMSKYFSAKLLLLISSIIEPKICETIAHENHRWTEEIYI